MRGTIYAAACDDLLRTNSSGTCAFCQYAGRTVGDNRNGECLKKCKHFAAIAHARSAATDQPETPSPDRADLTVPPAGTPGRRSTPDVPPPLEAANPATLLGQPIPLHDLRATKRRRVDGAGAAASRKPCTFVCAISVPA